MLQDRRAVMEQVQSLAAQLNTADRLALIRAIASLETPEDETESEAAVTGKGTSAEQEAWFARPAAERKRYAGEYVAVHEGQVVDHDADQRALFLRMRSRYGRRPVLIVRADWDTAPVYTIHSPRLEM
jgi:hypothetical protein